MTSDFTGRAALVTGASRGIGHGIALEVLSRGASVTITARKAEAVTEAAATLASTAGVSPDRVLAVPGNAGRADDRAEAVERTMERFGRLDVLVNNAGINPVFGSLMDADLDAVRKIFDVNVVAALGFVQLAWKVWMEEHGGAVVNIASVGGIRSTGVIAAYGASKAALIRLTEALYTGREEEAAAGYPMKRLGTPEDVARLVAFLASDEAEWITGGTVRVDGGLLSTGTVG
jgi:NAD(P)-dependent dehydrogenase (short-subunit alcohol dehydrogenase family)